MSTNYFIIPYYTFHPTTSLQIVATFISVGALFAHHLELGPLFWALLGPYPQETSPPLVV